MIISVTIQLKTVTVFELANFPIMDLFAVNSTSGTTAKLSWSDKIT